MTARIDNLPDALTAFCERWRIVKLTLFGSILWDDFGPKSDVGILVSFKEEAASPYAT